MTIAPTEHNKAVARTASFDPASVLALAERVAAISIFTGRPRIVEGVPGDLATSLDDLGWRDLESHSPLQASPRDLLGTGLVVADSEGYRFADRSTTEYLAACFLEQIYCRYQLRPDVWRQLLTFEIDNRRWVVPRLRGLAAWISELNGDAFDLVLECDPSILVESDLAAFQPQNLKRLFRTVIASPTSIRSAARSPVTLERAYRAASGRDDLDRMLASEDEEERRRGLEYIGSAKLREFDSVLVKIGLSSDESDLVRYWAIHSLSQETEQEHLESLRELLGDEAPADPGNRIRGMVLRLLWPRLLSTPEALAAVSYAPAAGAMLEYETFVLFDIVEGLVKADCGALIDWLAHGWDDDWERSTAKRLLEEVAGKVSRWFPDLSTGTRTSILRSLASISPRFLLSTFLGPFEGIWSSLCHEELLRFGDELIDDQVGESVQVAGFAICQVVRSVDRDVASSFVASARERYLVAQAEEERDLWAKIVAACLEPERDAVVRDWILSDGDEVELYFAGCRNALSIDSRGGSIGFIGAGNRESQVAPSSLVLALQRVLDGEPVWPDFVGQVLTRQPNLETRCLANIEPLSDLNADQMRTVRDMAATYLASVELVASNDSHGARLDELVLAHSVALLGDDIDAGLLTVEGRIDLLVRCDRFVFDNAYKQVHDALAGVAPVAYEASLIAHIDHAAVCSNCAGRVGALARAPLPLLSSRVRAHVLDLITQEGRSTANRMGLLRSALDGWSDFLSQELRMMWEAIQDDAGVGSGTLALIERGLNISRIQIEGLSDESTKRLIKAMAESWSWDERPDWLETLGIDELSALYRRATTLFGRSSGTLQSGFVTTGPREVDRLRSALLKRLGESGDEGVERLQSLASESEGIEALLGPSLLRDMVDGWASPLSQDQFLRLIVSNDTSVVRNGTELLAIIREGIRRYQESLHQVGGGAELLWDSNGRPREEKFLSLDLQRFLREHFSSGIVVNREVELIPASDLQGLQGERADLLVNAIDSNGATLSGVIEIKGSWNDEKYTGYSRQLVDRYLTHPDVVAGLHLVFWFDRESWDESDGRRGKSPKDLRRLVRTLGDRRPACIKPIDHMVVTASRSPR